VSPRSQKRTVRSTADAWHIFDDTPQRIVFLGHTHIPFLFGQKGGAGIGARFIEFRYNRPHPIDPEDRYVVCVGAVGYPRDGMNKIRYVIHDEAAQTIEFRAIAGELLPLGATIPAHSDASALVLPRRDTFPRKPPLRAAVTVPRRSTHPLDRHRPAPRHSLPLKVTQPQIPLRRCELLPGGQPVECGRLRKIAPHPFTLVLAVTHAALRLVVTCARSLQPPAHRLAD
jgi:diadenosine tetraphosphatase ApaH/serine/threonine PP2A family protein phosphatase